MIVKSWNRPYVLPRGDGTAYRRTIGTALTVAALAVFATTSVAAGSSPPGIAGALALSNSPIPADGSWQGYVESDGGSTAAPTAVVSTTGAVTNAQALVTGSGTTTLNNVAGQAPPTIVLDYGREVGGLPFFHVTSVSPTSPATSVTLRSGYSEAARYLFGAPPNTTLAAAAPAGSTNVSVNSVSGFNVGGPLTIDSGTSQESATITAVGTAAAAAKLYAAAAPGDTTIKVTSVANLSSGSAITIDQGSNQDQATITSVGSAGVNSTLTATTVTSAALPIPSYTGASFLWNAPGFTSSAPAGTILVRRDFTLTAAQLANLTDAALRVNVDDQHATFVNGVQVAASTIANGWRTSQLVDVKPDLVAGNNSMAIAAYNVSGAGGFIAALQMDFAPAAGVPGNQILIQTGGDGSWRTSQLGTPLCTTDAPTCIGSAAPAGWSTAGFDDSTWPAIPAGDAAAYPVGPWNTLANPNVPQPNIINVASATGFAAGDTIMIDPGTAIQESDTVASVATGSITLANNLTIVHTSGAAVLDLSNPGTGLTFTPALTNAHPVLTGFTSAGTGITFTPGLTSGHPAGTTLTTTSLAITGDANGNNGVGTDGSRADNFTLTTTTGGTTIGNAVTAVQGGERFQVIQLTTPGVVTLSGLGITVKFDNVGPSAYGGHFLSSDDTLNKIWYAGVYTAQTNGIPPGGVCSNATTCSTTPAILDGAKRDRRVWSGDLSVEGRTMFDSLGFDANGSDYIKYSIQGYGSAPLANGSTCGQTSNWVPLPAGPVACSFYSPTYSMYYVLDLAEYYLYSGDTAFAESQYRVMKNELAYNATSVDPATGLTTVAGSDWDFYDGSKGGPAAQGGAVTATNITYYKTLVDAAWLASQLVANDPGNADAATWTADAAAWSSQAATLKTAINSHLFNAGLGVYQLSSSNNGTHAATAIPQDANAEAIVYGVAPPENAGGILGYLKNNLWGTYGPQPYSPDANYSTVISPFVSGYELDARFATGDTSGALALTDLMWAQMVDPGGPFYTGTLWEKLGQNGQDTDSNASLAHGWATAPVSAFSSHLLGIAPTGPGYHTWRVAPQPGSLSWAQGQVPTPAGTPLVSRWRVGTNTSSFALTMSAPDGTTGTVAIPEIGASRTIAEDGHIVWQDGAPVGDVTASETDGAVVFSNVAGAHTFAWVTSVAPTLSVTHTADGHDGWNVTSPVTETVTASDAVSGLAGAPTCTDNGNDTTLTPSGSGRWTFAVSGDGLHSVSCSVTDNVDNETTATDTGKIDTTPPVVTYTGNAGSYTPFQTVTIDCSAVDPTPGSGIHSATTDCADVFGPAYSFGLGRHTATATANDVAGNSSTTSTTFTVTAGGCLGSRTGPLTVNAGQSVCLAPGAHQTGPVTVKAGGLFYADGATITGTVNATGAALVRICGTTITGTLTATGGTGIVVVGGDAATGPCAGNVITATANLTANTAGVEFNNNTVTGSLIITGNTGTLPPPDTGPVHATGNKVTGSVKIQH